jgi:hypothetical protein
VRTFMNDAAWSKWADFVVTYPFAVHATLM